jgi:N utilization substance protein A
VGKKGQRVRLVLSRTHGNFVRELFKAEIPEVSDGLIEIKGIVREPGRRTKIAVATQDQRIDPVGSCVGMRGSRITKVTDELGGEKIDIIPWAEDPAQFIENSLKPARVLRISYDNFRDRARVVVSQDQLPLAIGKAGQNVRLSARLTRYKIDVMSEEAAAQARVKGSEDLQRLIDASLLEDFLREVFLDNHLDSMAVLAAQTPDRLVEAFEAHHVSAEAAEKLIAHADSLLTDEQKSERDQIISRREQAEREEAEEAARALSVAEAETLASTQAAIQAESDAVEASANSGSESTSSSAP